MKLKLQPDKCEYLKPELQYLGHVITEEGVKPNPDKCKSVLQFPQPKNVKQIRQFLGLANYYRKFIKDFSIKAKPLTYLLQKKIEFKWGMEQEKAFTILKEELCREPILAFPDFSRTFTLTTDASDIALGGVLSQEKNGKEHPVAYTSRALSKPEKNYSTTEKELLAIVWCVKHFRPYLYGQKFKIITDHRPLTWLMNHKDPHSRLLRWKIMLSEYEFDISYKKGSLNTNADALSRNPVMVNWKVNDEGGTLGWGEELEVEEETPLQTRERKLEPRKEISEESIILGKRKRKSKLSFESKSRKHPRLEDQQTEDDHTEDQRMEDQPLEDQATSSTMEESGIQEKEILENQNEKQSKEIEENEEMQETLKLSKTLYLTNTSLPEGSVDVSFIKEKEEPKLEVFYEEENEEYHIVIGVNTGTKIEDLKNQFIELLYLAIAEEFKELHVDHGSCAGLSGLLKKDIEKLWKEIFNKGNTIIYLHDRERKIPRKEEIKKIIQENHDSLLGGHGGIKKTYYRISENYFWKTLRRDVEEYVRNCQTCQKNKVNRHPTKMPMMITDIPKNFNDKIAMDICGPLPLTSEMNKYALTIQDCLTKYCFAIPMKDFTASAVIDKFLKHFVSYFGVPRNILTDRGTNFTSELMKNFQKMLGIKHITTTSFHPENNGSLERSHQVLKDYLRHFSNENADDWDTKIHLASLYYNTSKDESTGYTPCELVFGINPRDVSSLKTSNISYSEYLDDLQKKIQKTLYESKKIMLQSKERTKDRYDRMINPKEFREGDLVWLRNESVANKKTNALNLPFERPFEILRKVSDTNYIINKKSKEYLVHANRLKFANINLFQNPDD